MSKQWKFLQRSARPGFFAGCCGAGGLLIGLRVIAGWHLGRVEWIRLQPNLTPAQYLTAWCLVASGLGVIFAAFKGPRVLSALLGAAVSLIGTLVSLEYLTGWDCGMDALTSHFPHLEGLNPSKSSSPTAAALAFLGAGLMALHPRLEGAPRRVCVWIFGSPPLALSLMVLFGYYLGLTGTFVTGTLIGMSFHTGMSLALLSTGLLLTQLMSRKPLLDDRWLPVPVGIGVMAAAFMLWQTMAADRARAIHDQAEVVAKNVASDCWERFQFSLRSLTRLKDHWLQRGGTPYNEWRLDARACIVDQSVLLAVARTRPDWVVEWVEPKVKGSPLEGRDLRHEDRWNAVPALENAVKTKTTVISPTVELLGGIGRGFIAYLPVFRGEQFDGFLIGIFRLQNLKRAVFDRPAYSNCRIAFYENDTLIMGDLPLRPADEKTSVSKEIDFYQHKFRFLVEPDTAVLAGARLPVVTLWLGSMLALALSAAVWGLQEARVRNLARRTAYEKLQEETAERQAAEKQQRKSEKRLSQVLDSAIGVSVITTDPDGKITYFSKGAERILGWTSEEMTGIDGQAIIHDATELQTRSEAMSTELGYPVEGTEIFSAVPLREGSERREWTWLRKDGTRRIVDLVVTPLEDGEGGPSPGLLGTATDITERKQMERELRETLMAKKTAQALLESAGRIARLGHWELPLGGDGPIWSDITCSIHELPPGTSVSLQSAIHFYHPQDRSVVREKVSHAILTGEPFEGEVRLITANGNQIWVYIRGEAVRDDAGKTVALRGIIQDIDERHKAAELLRQRNLQLEEATARAEAHARAKTEFLANMSHEIRTPLNAVIGMSELLMDGELDPREREFVETIHASGDVLLGLINDILDFSKIESGQLDLERIPVPLRDCVESVLDLLATQAARKKLDLMYWIDPEVPEAILGDPTRLRQVLMNLAGNAIKFTSEGEVFIKLTVTIRPGGERCLHVAVSDSGIGIPAGQTDRLFGAFNQLDASTTRRFGGTGLGLAICHRLILNMRGRIWVESQEGKGSVFQFEIPLHAAVLPAAAAAGEAFSTGSTGIRSMEGMRLLVVDDNATNRWILQMQAESWHMRPTTVEGARQALALLDAGENFDLAIIDGLMPEMNGYALAAEIRRRLPEQDLPILMLTSLGDRPPDSGSLGISGILTKPVKNAALFNAVRNVLSTARRAASGSVGVPGGADSTSGDKPGGTRPLRILVAEDNPVNQRVVALHLQRMGYTAAMANNGLEALAALADADAPFDVVLLDVQMPEMDGLEAAREICRRYPAGSRPWMIALTANALGGDRDECLAAGMDDYLAKPVRGETLQRALHTAYDHLHSGTSPSSSSPE